MAVQAKTCVELTIVTTYTIGIPAIFGILSIHGTYLLPDSPSPSQNEDIIIFCNSLTVLPLLVLFTTIIKPNLISLELKYVCVMFSFKKLTLMNLEEGLGPFHTF